MKNLILRICLLFTFLLSTPAFSGIGDVYYCVTDMFVLYDEEKNSIKYDTKGYKFKFKWEEKMIKFSGDFIYSGHLYLDKNNDLSFMDSSFQASFRQNFAFFEEPKLRYSDFFYQQPKRSVYATCEKF